MRQRFPSVPSFLPFNGPICYGPCCYCCMWNMSVFTSNDPKFPFDFTDYPITHSLLMGIVWGLCFGGLYWLLKKDARGALVIGICVVSHWVLDLIVHQPDLPLFPGNSPKVGLGLWNWPLLTGLVEGILFVTGTVMYLRRHPRQEYNGQMVILVAGGVTGHRSYSKDCSRHSLLPSRPSAGPDSFNGYL